MAVEAGRVTVGTTPTVIRNVGDAPTRLVLKNAGAASVFIGGSTVATTDGFELAAGATLTLDASQDSSDDVYAIVATAGPIVHFLAY